MFETGKLTPLNLKPIHITSMLSEVLEAAYATDERGNIKDLLRLSIRCSNRVPPVVCADSSLQRILFNLVSNAMQFCSEKGEVSLAVHFSQPKPTTNSIPQPLSGHHTPLPCPVLQCHTLPCPILSYPCTFIPFLHCFALHSIASTLCLSIFHSFSTSLTHPFYPDPQYDTGDKVSILQHGQYGQDSLKDRDQERDQTQAPDDRREAPKEAESADEPQSPFSQVRGGELVLILCGVLPRRGDRTG